MNYTIGGSDIAAICGVSRFSTPLKVWAVKKGFYQIEKTEAMEIGTELEEYVAKKFTERTGIKVRRKNEALKHQKNEYLIGHVDRITADGGILEVKTTNAYAAKDWETYPVEYEYQLNWYLGLAGKTKGYFAALIGGQKIVIREYQFNQQLFQTEVESAIDFYNNYLLKDIPPVALAGDYDTVNVVYPLKDETVQFDAETERIVDEIQSLKIEIKQLTDKKDELEVKLKQLIGGATIARGEKYTVTQTVQKRKIVDTERLKKDGLYDNYTVVKESIVMRIKGGQEDEQI